jgi:tetraacyldisaccharide-1-P 4'-kinase
LDLVCIDAAEPISGLKLLPAGRLRERLSGLNRAGGLIWTGCTQYRPSDELVACVSSALDWDIPVFRSVSTITGFSSITGESETLSADTFHGQSVALLAAIARPQRFVEGIENTGTKVVWSVARRDHHAWHPEEIELMVEQARQRGARAVLTTGKDAVKMTGFGSLALPLYRVDSRAEIQERESFEALLNTVFHP